MTKFLDLVGLTALWNKIKLTFYTKSEVYTKTELDDIVAHELAASLSGDLTAELPTVSEVINEANAYILKVSPTSVFVTNNKCGILESIDKYSFNDIQNITVVIRNLLKSTSLNHYNMRDIIGIYLSDTTYIKLSIEGYTCKISLKINGTLTHNETIGDIRNTGINLNSYGDFAVTYDKNEKLFRIIGYDVSNTAIILLALYDISLWDLSSLTNVKLYTSVSDYGYPVCCTTVLINSASSLHNYIAIPLNYGSYNIPQGTLHIKDISYVGTGLTSDGTLVSTTSDTSKVFSVSKSSESYFKLGQTNTDTKFGWYHLKLTFTSVGSGAYITSGAGSRLIMFESNKLPENVTKLYPTLGKTYDLYVQVGTLGLGYCINYGLRVLGDLTFEVSEPYLFNPLIQNICAETYNGKMFTGAIPFQGDVYFLEYISNGDSSSTSCRIPTYTPAAISSGVLRMWNGSTWKNISS